MLTALPLALLSLLFASPVFATASTTVATSPNDLFRAVALRVPKQPQNPTCYLKLTPSELVDDGALLSFEEWKLKQEAIQRGSPLNPTDKEPASRGATKGPGDGGVESGTGSSSEPPATPANNSPPSGSSSPESAAGGWTDFSFLQIPTTDRFNYASLDCSARVHTAHRSAKSPSSILSSKRDRYMLSPCDASKEKHFVVVELCDDIRIDTVQLANFEFFSGVFKDFTVSVAKTYTTDPDGWTLVKGYQAKNVRGVQTFRPPTSLRDFYRFIRIDFLSHYGNEYYCPVSLLRVYGLTHLEEWKWDIWESESRQKQADLQKKRVSSLAVGETPELSMTPNTMDSATQLETKVATASVVQMVTAPPLMTSIVVYHSKSISSPSPSQSQDFPTSTISKNADSSSTIPMNEPRSSNSGPLGLTQKPSHTDNGPAIHPTDEYVSSSHSMKSALPSQAYSQDTGSIIPLADSLSPSPTNPSIFLHEGPRSPLAPNQTHHASDSPTVVISSTLTSVSAIPVVTTPSSQAVKGGESIYRTILNRLTEVETNHTLYMRYIEQQNLAVRDVIKRLGEDVGRLEGISRAQSLTYQRTLDNWERQRYQLEMEYGDLISRFESLSEEIVLEKRLGVAQLCLLLAVLIFLGLTRGSRAETLVDHSSTQINRSVREWGRRHFKLSGDWAGRFKGKNIEIPRNSRSRSTSRTRTPPVISRPRPQTANSYSPHLSLHIQEDDNMVAFPSNPTRLKEPLGTIQLNTAPPGREFYTRPRTRTISNPRSRAPSLWSTPTARRIQHIAHQRPITPITASLRPHLFQRSSSQGIPSVQLGGSMSMPKSAKRWARTAHLHEVKTAAPNPSGGSGRRRKLGGSSPMRHDRENHRTPEEFDFERERDDLFSSPIPKLSTNTINMEAGRSPPELGLLLKPEVVMDDGDSWVDTDSVDGSEDPDQNPMY